MKDASNEIISDTEKWISVFGKLNKLNQNEKEIWM